MPTLPNPQLVSTLQQKLRSQQPTPWGPGTPIGSLPGTPGPQAPSVNDPKAYLAWLLNQGTGALGGAQNDAAPGSYYDARSKAADAGSDAALKAYQDQVTRSTAEANAGPTGGTFSYQDYTNPAYDGGPQAPTVDPYDAWAKANAGRTGNTTEGDLTQYGDKNYYLGNKSTLPDYLQSALDNKGGTDIGSPDFQGAFDRYAGAANDKFTRTLGLQTDDLVGASMGRGRFNSGFLDEDYGNLARGLASDARADADSHAVDVLGLQESDTASRRATAASRATSQGQLALDAANIGVKAGEDAAAGGATQATNARANRTELNNQYRDERDSAEKTFEDRRDTGRANYESDRTYGTNTYNNNRDFAYKGFTDNRADAYNRRNYATGALADASKAASDNSNTGYSRIEDQRNRYLDLLNGTTDRAQGAVNDQAKRKSSLISSIIGGVGSVAGAVLPALLP